MNSHYLPKKSQCGTEIRAGPKIQAVIFFRRRIFFSKIPGWIIFFPTQNSNLKTSDSSSGSKSTARLSKTWPKSSARTWWSTRTKKKLWSKLSASTKRFWKTFLGKKVLSQLTMKDLILNSIQLHYPFFKQFCT